MSLFLRASRLQRGSSSRKEKLSSILKALKKIDADSAAPQAYPSLAKSIDSKQALNSGTRKRWRIRRYLNVTLILLAIAVAIIILFSQRRLIIAKVSSVVSSQTQTANVSSTSGKPNTFRAKVPAASAKSDTMPPVNTRRLNNPVKSPVSGGNQQKYQADTRSKARLPSSGQRNLQASTPKPQPKTEMLAKPKNQQKKALSPPNSALTAKPVARERKAPREPKVKTDKSAKTAPIATYDRLNDSKLKLQALAWFDDADRRMAVINDRIVHEGESVEGYQVTKIRQEDVIVKNGGKSWRLEFGLQQ